MRLPPLPVNPMPRPVPRAGKRRDQEILDQANMNHLSLKMLTRKPPIKNLLLTPLPLSRVLEHQEPVAVKVLRLPVHQTVRPQWLQPLVSMLPNRREVPMSVTE